MAGCRHNQPVTNRESQVDSTTSKANASNRNRIRVTPVAGNPTMPVEAKPIPISRLAELDAKWRVILTSAEQCPPVLGLAAFSEEEESEIIGLTREAITVSYGTPLDGLLRLLERRPAAMLVWLARKAGVAYDDGNFWEHLEREIGVHVPIPRRGELVSLFSRRARELMTNFTPPPSLGAFHLMETLLFHAGLPLCHCASFAKACRWVEEHSGLPDPESAEAGEELRDAALACSYIRGIPILLKALRGPAGPLVCAEALNLVFEQDGPPANPRLTSALREAFANVGAGGPRRSARSPFLRLSADLCSLQVVGPRQDSALLTGHGLVWVVNGMPHRCGPEEEFIFTVRDEVRVEMELRGLASGLTCRRVFDFEWATRPVPFLVFDTESRRERRADAASPVTLRSGEYLLVHPVEMSVSDTSSRYDWPDGRNAISQLTLRPQRDVRLEGGRPVTFHAAQAPFLEPDGQIVRTDDGKRIHYGWTRLPEIWCPAEDELPTDWQLNIALDGHETPHVFRLRGGEKQGSFLRFVAAETDWLNFLPPRLHHLRCTVTRGGRRVECDQEFFYWAGLSTWTEGEGFECDAIPLNLHLPDCRGFEHAGSLICHRTDARREHALAFDVAREICAFHWSRSGLFLESFERRAGVVKQAEAHRLGASFSADVKSPLWLRVWHVPGQEGELRANGKFLLRFAPGRTSADVSLAHLSTLFAQGGNLTLIVCGLETRVASFHRPLTPTIIDHDLTEDYESLILKFSDEIRWIRPRLKEIVSGREVEFEGQRFTSSGHCLFREEGLPAVECAILCDNIGHESQFCRVSLDVPKAGWPAGVWFGEIEIRQDETQGWQPVRDELGGHTPLVWLEAPAHSLDDARSQAIWWAAGTARASEFIPDYPPDFASQPAALADLLAECDVLLTRGHATVVWPRVQWNQTLYGELARQAARLIDANDASLRRPLLAAVAREQKLTPRSLLVSVPALLASPGENFGGFQNEDPLRRALMWIAGLAVAPSVSTSLHDQMVRCFQNGQTSGLLATLQHFRNFTSVVQSGANSDGRDFFGFDFSRYWQQTIGSIQTPPDGDEWQECEALGRQHVHAAIAAMLSRRRQEAGGKGLAAAGGIFALTEDFCRWLRSAMGARANIMTDVGWKKPWLEVDIPDDALAVQCSRFCSVFALAARASAAGHLKFGDVTSWLHHRPRGVSDTAKAVATLVCLAPELLGYHLMFWELICRTSRHD